MANVTLLEAINATLTHSSWEVRCINQLNASALSFDWTDGLVDSQGNNVPRLTVATWGITVETCLKYCSASQIPYALNFDFQDFAASMTNYFLPWLALTAQLPFETGDVWSNVMSFCMAVGSPAMITYSLTVTIFNRYWINERFRTLQEAAGVEPVIERRDFLQTRIRAALYLLQEAQQVPLRLSQVDGWLSSLIVLPTNAGWWEKIEKHLRSTRRGFTASLVAQMMFASLAYLFTVISSFTASLGDPDTALQIASGSIWIWLIPVILGWITVGTQTSDHSIKDALDDQPANRAMPRFLPTIPGRRPAEHQLVGHRTQKGISVLNEESSGLPAQPERNQSEYLGFEVVGDGHLKQLTWLGANVGGDEQLKGPLYNYARVFTWRQLASTICLALGQTIENVEKGEICENLDPLAVPNTGQNSQWKDNLIGDRWAVAEYCGLDKRPVRAYPEWFGDEKNNGLSSKTYRHMLVASVTAFFVQWGTTGASVFIAYLTPTLGLGCRSTSYIAYGVMGTAAWIFLLCSMLLSHTAMLKYQDLHVGPNGDGPHQTPRRRRRLRWPLKTSGWLQTQSFPLLQPSASPQPTTSPLLQPSTSQLSSASQQSLTSPQQSALPQQLIERKRDRGIGHTALCAAAVITRYCGKTIAIINTLWLILSSLLEYVGGYDNCWCKSDYLGLGNAGWVELFKNAEDLALAARPIWGGGLAMTLGVCVIAYAVFALTSWESD